MVTSDTNTIQVSRTIQTRDFYTTVPLVSIIIPTKNRCDLLLQTLESVRSQTSPHWEAIVVDDGSDDATIEQMESLSKKESRIRFLRGTGDRTGANVRRNQGLEASKGEYVIFLDSDDILAPPCLEHRMAAMQGNARLDFGVFPGWIFREQPGDMTLLWNADTEEDDLDRFLSLDVPWQTMCPIWRRRALDTLGPWNEEINCVQDWEYHLRALCLRLTYRKFPGPDCFYRVPKSENNSISARSNSPNYLRIHESLLEPVREMLIASRMFNERRTRLLAGLYFLLAMRWQGECGSTPEALRVWRACRESKLVGFKDYCEGLLFLRAKDQHGIWRLRGSMRERFRARYPAFRGSATIYWDRLAAESKRPRNIRAEVGHASGS